MATKSMESHLTRLEELVFDDDKIVTVWNLASLLSVPVKEAKEILINFINITKEKHPDRFLAVTHSIIGTLKKSSAKGVTIVKEDELAAKKLEFSEINDECVYSVQKNDKIDLNIVALANDEALIGLEVPLKHLVLASKNCTRRNIKKPIAPVVAEKKKPEPKKEDSVQKSSSSKQSGIKNLFSNVPAKAKPDKPENTKKPDQKPKNNPLSAFLASKPTKSKPKPDESKKEEKQEAESSPVKENDENRCDNAEKMDVDDDKGKKSAKRQRKEKNSGQSAKKRRRIVIKEDSDSDDIFGDDNEEKNAVKEFDDEEEVVAVEKPVKVQESEPVPKNKRRKAVEKTYEDEEGYIVTKTEYILETASETEEEPVKKPKNEKIDQKKEKINNGSKKGSSSSVEDPSPKRGGGGGKKAGKKAVASNQKSITSFFTKK